MAVFECPSCNEVLEVDPPDRLHSAFSSAKPTSKSSKIIQKKVRCQNQECKKTITVYWYVPMEYFCRV